MEFIDELPPDPSQRNRRKNFVEGLKAQPGRWAQYEPGHPHYRSVKSAFERTFPGVEVASRPRHGDPSRVDIYVRWIGDQ